MMHACTSKSSHELKKSHSRGPDSHPLCPDAEGALCDCEDRLIVGCPKADGTRCQDAAGTLDLLGAARLLSRPSSHRCRLQTGSACEPPCSVVALLVPRLVACVPAVSVRAAKAPLK